MGKASKIDEQLISYARWEDFSGAVLVARKGTVLLCKGYELADREKDVPNTPQTRFRLGSITKSFTAMAIMILQNMGRFKFQDPICNYIPDCSDTWQEITIHHLMTHTSGITNFTNLPDYNTTKISSTTPSQAISRLKNLPLDFKPGEEWRYSNSGYVVLGYIIEQVSKLTYETFLQQNIFEPLKMNNTGYDHNDNSLAIGYTYGWRKADFINMTVPYAAGGLYSTIEDLYLWDQALYKDKMVPQDLMDLMFTPQAKMHGIGSSYGYGWKIMDRNNRRAICHDGKIEGFSNFILRYPNEKAIIIILSNRRTIDPEAVANRISTILL